jgi:hypothetical protein
LGRKVGGEDALPVRGSAVVWPFAQLKRHAVIFGDPTSGRVETAMRMAHDVALKLGAPVFCVDGKGDPELAERFVATMAAVGRTARVFPDEPFDAWRGDPLPLATRLHTVLGFERDDSDHDSFLEVDLSGLMLNAACRGFGGPPQSSGELLERLDYDSLRAVSPDWFGDMRRDMAERVRSRVKHFFEGLDGAFDGELSWDDADAAYIRLGDDWQFPRRPKLARFFFEDWMHYLRERKAPGRPSLMLASGLGAEMSGRELQQLLEQAKQGDSGVVASWDSPADIGSETDRTILFGALWTIIVHRTHTPDLAAQIGDKEVSELETERYVREGRYEVEHLVRRVEKPKLGPEDFAALPDGNAWIIESGKVTKVATQ